jgi:hypothetical protein
VRDREAVVGCQFPVVSWHLGIETLATFQDHEALKDVQDHEAL